MGTEVKIPHPKFFSGESIKHHMRTFLEQTIDAEWRATCLKDPSIADWLQQFHLGFMIDYMVVAGHFDKEDIITWSNEIRGRYDWKV